jgi:hypothetical protein
VVGRGSHNGSKLFDVRYLMLLGHEARKPTSNLKLRTWNLEPRLLPEEIHGLLN